MADDFISNQRDQDTCWAHVIARAFTYLLIEHIDINGACGLQDELYRDYLRSGNKFNTFRHILNEIEKIGGVRSRSISDIVERLLKDDAVYSKKLPGFIKGELKAKLYFVEYLLSAEMENIDGCHINSIRPQEIRRNPVFREKEATVRNALKSGLGVMVGMLLGAKQMETLKNGLKASAIIGYSNKKLYNELPIIPSSEEKNHMANHAVFLSALRKQKDSTSTFLEFKNSWGYKWGNRGKFQVELPLRRSNFADWKFEITNKEPVSCFMYVLDAIAGFRKRESVPNQPNPSPKQRIPNPIQPSPNLKPVRTVNYAPSDLMIRDIRIPFLPTQYTLKLKDHYRSSSLGALKCFIENENIATVESEDIKSIVLTIRRTGETNIILSQEGFDWDDDLKFAGGTSVAKLVVTKLNPKVDATLKTDNGKDYFDIRFHDKIMSSVAEKKKLLSKLTVTTNPDTTESDTDIALKCGNEELNLKVKVKRTGLTQITFGLAETNNYEGSNYKCHYYCSSKIKKPILEVKIIGDSRRDFGSGNIDISVSSSSPANLVFLSGNNDVINGIIWKETRDGKQIWTASICGVGRAKIEILQEANEEYESGVACVFLEVKPVDAVITFNQDEIVLNHSDNVNIMDYINASENNDTSLYEFHSSDRRIVTIDSEGNIACLKVGGKSVITVCKRAFLNYKKGENCITVSVKGDPNLRFSNKLYKSYVGDKNIQIEAWYGVSRKEMNLLNLWIDYKSDNPDIAMIEKNDGKRCTLSALRPGKAHITATLYVESELCLYSESSASVEITVFDNMTKRKKNPNLSVKLTDEEVTGNVGGDDVCIAKDYGCDPFDINDYLVTDNEKTSMKFKSNNTDVAVVNVANGMVTILGAGEASIDVTQDDETGEYELGCVSLKISINKASPKLRFKRNKKRSLHALLCFGFTEFPITDMIKSKNENGIIKCLKSYDACVADVGDDGLVRCGTVMGKTTVTFRQEADGNFLEDDVYLTIDTREDPLLSLHVYDSNRQIGDVFDICSCYFDEMSKFWLRRKLIEYYVDAFGQKDDLHVMSTHLFNKFVANKNSVVDVSEMKYGIKLLLPSEDEDFIDTSIDNLFKFIDRSGDGLIQLDEFTEFLKLGELITFEIIEQEVKPSPIFKLLNSIFNLHEGFVATLNEDSGKVTIVGHGKFTIRITVGETEKNLFATKDVEVRVRRYECVGDYFLHVFIAIFVTYVGLKFLANFRLVFFIRFLLFSNGDGDMFD